MMDPGWRQAAPAANASRAPLVLQIVLYSTVCAGSRREWARTPVRAVRVNDLFSARAPANVDSSALRAPRCVIQSVSDVPAVQIKR